MNATAGKTAAWLRDFAVRVKQPGDTDPMTTATHDVQTEPVPAESGVLDTGPQAVLELAEQGLPQRTIASRLHISQATVTRRIREALEARRDRRRAYAMAAMCTVLTLCAVVLTIAVSCLAWA